MFIYQILAAYEHVHDGPQADIQTHNTSRHHSRSVTASMAEVDVSMQDAFFSPNGLLSEASFMPNGLLNGNSLMQEEPQAPDGIVKR